MDKVTKTEIDIAFKQLKYTLQEKATIPFIDYSQKASPLELYKDASAVGAETVLLQKQGDNNKIITHLTKSFYKAESMFLTAKRKLATLHMTVRTF